MSGFAPAYAAGLAKNVLMTAQRDYGLGNSLLGVDPPWRQFRSKSYDFRKKLQQNLVLVKNLKRLQLPGAEVLRESAKKGVPVRAFPGL